MADDNPFVDLLTRARGGDPDAAAELVRRYEPAIRVVVRAHLVDDGLRRHFDSLDVCQSVLGSFFVRAAAGQYDLAEPAQLVALLARMTRNKLAMQARRFRQAKRDARRNAGDAALEGAAAAGSAPSSVVANRELLAVVMTKLSAEEREIARRRGENQEWAQIAAEMGGTAEGRRKQFARALDRVETDLGLHDAEAEDD